MNSFGFMNTELTVEDLLDVSLSNGKTASKLRGETIDGVFHIFDRAADGTEFIRCSRFIDPSNGELTVECFDENGEYNDWGSRPAISVREAKTNSLIYSERYSHGVAVHTRMSVPHKSEFEDLE